jgi:broad specificity phosphatase PhoE
MPTELVLVRHGHAVKIKGDYVNAPLTELGQKQAELTGTRFCGEEFDGAGFYTSPLRRTKETAAIIGSRTGKFPTVRQGIQELEGYEVPTLVLMEFLAHVGWFGSYLYENIGKPLHWPIVGRVSSVVSDLVEKHAGGRVVVVTHSGVISSVLAWYFPNMRRRWWIYTVDNCSLTRLMIEGTRAELVRVNDTDHLSDALTTKQAPAATVETAKKAEEKVEEIVLQKKDKEKDAMIR